MFDGSVSVHKYMIKVYLFILPVLLLSITPELDIVGSTAPVLEGRVLWADAILDGLGRHDVRVCALNHFVGIDALVTGHVDGQRIIAQGLHLVDGQVAVRLVAQCIVLAWKT